MYTDVSFWFEMHAANKSVFKKTTQKQKKGNREEKMEDIAVLAGCDVTTTVGSKRPKPGFLQPEVGYDPLSFTAVSEDFTNLG